MQSKRSSIAAYGYRGLCNPSQCFRKQPFGAVEVNSTEAIFVRHRAGFLKLDMDAVVPFLNSWMKFKPPSLKLHTLVSVPMYSWSRHHGVWAAAVIGKVNGDFVLLINRLLGCFFRTKHSFGIVLVDFDSSTKQCFEFLISCIPSYNLRVSTR